MRLLTYVLDAVGAALIVGGVAWLSLPAAVIVAGVFAIVESALLERRA